MRSFGKKRRARPKHWVKIQNTDVRIPDDFETAFAAMTKERADAVVVLPDPLSSFGRVRLAELATRAKLPSIATLKDFPEAGGLIS
jgi:putative ABC transport system substrate-binding protein